MIGLCGSHRVGKSTLAQAFAERTEIPFVQTSASQVFALLGKDPKVDYPIEERIAIQEALLYAFERQFEAARKVTDIFITDRTPIDLASYLISDVQRGTFADEPGLSKMVNDYTQRCLEATNQWFATVILVQPGITLVEASGKAPCCPSYIEHLNLIQSGLLIDERLLSRHYVIPRRYTDLEDRVKCVKGAAEHAVLGQGRLHCQLAAAGIALH